MKRLLFIIAFIIISLPLFSQNTKCDYYKFLHQEQQFYEMPQWVRYMDGSLVAANFVILQSCGFEMTRRERDRLAFICMTTTTVIIVATLIIFD